MYNVPSGRLIAVRLLEARTMFPGVDLLLCVY